MAKSITREIPFFSNNALQMIDLAFLKEGKAAEYPRVKKLDAVYMPVILLSKTKNHPLKADAEKLVTDLGEILVVEQSNMELIRQRVSGNIDNDPLLAGYPRKSGSKFTVKLKTDLAWSVIRLVMIYDQLMQDILMLRDTGVFINSNDDKRLIRDAGLPIRRFLQKAVTHCNKLNNKLHESSENEFQEK